MSHFSEIKTQFTSLFYLRKALDKLKLFYKLEGDLENLSNAQENNINIIIPQSNNYPIKFCRNQSNEKYRFLFDENFWEQSDSIPSFLNKITQQYATEVIIGESQQVGFEPIEYQKNKNGSATIKIIRYKK